MLFLSPYIIITYKHEKIIYFTNIQDSDTQYLITVLIKIIRSHAFFEFNEVWQLV